MTEREMRKKEQSIDDEEELVSILRGAKHVTIAMCSDGEPYLVTVNHGYDVENRAVFFHCAQEGKKVDIMKSNPVVWGQALDDRGYVEGDCDQYYSTCQFRGMVTFVTDLDEKRHALEVIIKNLEPVPGPVIEKHVTQKSVREVNIVRIDVEYMSGKRSE
jgi:nitroimidazol reductase NimA-like FMN-containing flavoprotein (pyridoxamine 5'-phosphate oxidase superfamily)